MVYIHPDFPGGSIFVKDGKLMVTGSTNAERDALKAWLEGAVERFAKAVERCVELDNG